MLAALQHLKSIGCQRVYIDGSFVTAKDFPGDYDACWERGSTNLHLLDPVLQDFASGRIRQKAKYGGEWFPSDSQANPAGATFFEFFQLDRSNNLKGIIGLDLESVP
jgi:hypothetical protein